MIDIIYYTLMLLLGYAVYRYGQKQLAKGYRDENDEVTKPPLGPVSFVVCAAITGFLSFGLLRALARGEIECVGKGCRGQVYTLAEQAGQYWSNMFFLAWIVLFLAYILYVTFRMWRG
ncbi:hypothetical protein [Acidovorax sp.]|uniref:hypothetical protein n=1 Tax=Acidovorax sp. TaxID=1872122 RepID=UPI003D0402DF